jgi:transcriptional regulator with XRE-family HTH domain
MKSDTTSAGRLIREARLGCGISQRSLARRAGTSQAAISRIERGLERPTVERLEQILAGLGWKLGLELEPIAGHRAETRRLYESARLAPAERLEAAAAWINVAIELAGTAR